MKYCPECGRRHWPKPDITIHWWPAYHSIRLVLTTKAAPGHQWMYAGIVRRDTFTIHGWGLVIIRMPQHPRQRVDARESLL